MDSVRISSFNIKNVKSSYPELAQLCDSCDVILLQETWLADDELQYLNSFDKRFYAKSLSSMNSENGIVRGRPYGGISILWKKSLGNQCNIQLYDDTRLMGLEICGHNVNLLIINVYMPCDYGNNLNEYNNYLSKVSNVIDSYNSPYVYVVGDFNAHLKSNGSDNSRFGVELSDFCENESLVISDFDFLSNNSCVSTFSNVANNCQRWLDHVVSTVSAHSLIEDIKVLDDFVTSDHVPICVDINISHSKVCIADTINEVHHIDWNSLSDKDVTDYTDRCSHALEHLIYSDAISCNHTNCQCKDHIDALEKMYNDIICILQDESKSLCTQRDTSKQHSPIPGWNSYVKVAHSEAREAYVNWRDSNKPKQGHIFNTMRQTRAYFKYCLRFCKSIESVARADALAKKLLMKDNTAFWKEMRKALSSGTNFLSSTIDGVTGEGNVAKHWKEHYSSLLNSNPPSKYKSTVTNDIKYELKSCTNYSFTVNDVSDAIKDMKCGKSCGLDTLQSEHFKYGSDRLVVLLSLLFSAMLTHGYLPDSLMRTVLIPVVKDKRGIVTNSDNYRPIAITSVASKILESLLLKCIKDCVKTTHNQFGFKPKHGTDSCVFILKSIVDMYTANGSPVFICFLDSSKAFDRLDHWALFYKMLAAKCNILVIRLLRYWYTTQTFCVKWGSTYSDCFTVINGVRQGGIMSPALFNLYMDDLSNVLNGSGIGCHLNSLPYNHLLYADDSCLIAPSAAALQKLINMCAKFADDNYIVFNVKKSHCMCIKPKCLKTLRAPTIYLNNQSFSYIEKTKYLGVILSSNGLCDEEDIKRHVRTLYRQGNMLVKRFKSCSVDVKNFIFKTYCSSIYCGQLWSNYRKSTFKRIIVAYNDIYRHLFNIRRGESMSAIYVHNGIDSVNVLLRKLIYGFIQRLQSSENVLVTSLIENEDFTRTRLSTKWHNMLYL